MLTESGFLFQATRSIEIVYKRDVRTPDGTYSGAQHQPLPSPFHRLFPLCKRLS